MIPDRSPPSAGPGASRTARGDGLAPNSKLRHGLVLAGYALLSVVVFGRKVVGDPAHTVVGVGGFDQSFFMWALEWMPHAISRGINPLHTDLVFAPDGWNLAWTTIVPGPAVVAAPVTLIAGPFVSYNLLMLAAPALAAWTAYLLCYELVGRTGPALAGGLVFGFSSYMATHALAHLNLALCFPIPLAALFLVRYVHGSLDGRGLVWRLAATQIVLYSIFVELAFSAMLAMFGGLGLAWLLAGPARPRVLRATAMAVVSTVVMAIVTAPYTLYALLRAPRELGRLTGLHNPMDAANLLIPTRATMFDHLPFGASAAAFHGSISEQGAYLGPVALLVVLCTALIVRTRLAVGATVFAVLVYLAAVGPLVWVHASSRLVVPWHSLFDLPIVRHMLPARFEVYAWLAVAVLVALLCARLRSLPAVALAVGLAVTLAPAGWGVRITVPRPFTNDSWRQLFPPGSTVLAVPVASRGYSMLWQARAHFGFRLTNGYVDVFAPEAVLRFPAYLALTRSGTPLPRNARYEVRRLLHDRTVDAVVVDDSVALVWRTVFASVLGSGHRVGGVTVWRVPRSLTVGVPPA
jgi:hypothetical protein